MNNIHACVHSMRYLSYTGSSSWMSKTAQVRKERGTEERVQIRCQRALSRWAPGNGTPGSGPSKAVWVIFLRSLDGWLGFIWHGLSLAASA